MDGKAPPPRELLRPVQLGRTESAKGVAALGGGSVQVPPWPAHLGEWTVVQYPSLDEAAVNGLRKLDIWELLEFVSRQYEQPLDREAEGEEGENEAERDTRVAKAVASMVFTAGGLLEGGMAGAEEAELERMAVCMASTLTLLGKTAALTAREEQMSSSSSPSSSSTLSSSVQASLERLPLQSFLSVCLGKGVLPRVPPSPAVPPVKVAKEAVEQEVHEGDKCVAQNSKYSAATVSDELGHGSGAPQPREEATRKGEGAEAERRGAVPTSEEEALLMMMEDCAVEVDEEGDYDF